MTASGAATDDIVRALVGRVVELFGLTVDVDVIHTDAAFIGQDVVSIGGHEFDSMDLLEILVTLEDELGVAFIEDINVDALDTLGAFAEHAGEAAPSEVLTAFVERWSIDGLSVVSGSA